MNNIDLSSLSDPKHLSRASLLERMEKERGTTADEIEQLIQGGELRLALPCPDRWRDRGYFGIPLEGVSKSGISSINEYVRKRIGHVAVSLEGVARQMEASEPDLCRISEVPLPDYLYNSEVKMVSGTCDFLSPTNAITGEIKWSRFFFQDYGKNEYLLARRSDDWPDGEVVQVCYAEKGEDFPLEQFAKDNTETARPPSPGPYAEGEKKNALTDTLVLFGNRLYLEKGKSISPREIFNAIADDFENGEGSETAGIAEVDRATQTISAPNDFGEIKPVSFGAFKTRCKRALDRGTAIH